MQETQGRSLVRENPACHEQLSTGVTTSDPVLWSLRAATTEPACSRARALTRAATAVRTHVPQLERSLYFQ